MRKSTRNLLAALAFGMFMFVGPEVIASPPGGGGGPGGQGGCIPPPCVPIDGGISALIVAGVALGGKKIFDSMKN